MSGPAILITGASGVVGRALCGALSGKDAPPLSCLSRNLAASPERNATWINGSLLDAARLRAALAGAGTAVHLALREPAAPAAEAARLHVEGTRALIEACRAERVERLWMLSSVHARDASAEAWPWAASLRAAEALLRESGLAWGVVRAPLLLGPRVPSALRLAALARWPVVPLDARVELEPLALDDLAAGLALAARTPALDGAAHELGGGQVLPLGELVARLRAARGAGRPRFAPALRGVLTPFAPGGAAGLEELRRGAVARPGALAQALGSARAELGPLLARLARS
jgi:nucleoside-diphosphate-sugar epimerase